MRKAITALCLGTLASLALPLLAQAQGADSGATSSGRLGAGQRDPAKMHEMFEQRFKKADTNGDGKLSKTEAQAGMPRVAKNFDAIDTDKDGFITQAEIAAAMASRQGSKGGPTAPKCWRGGTPAARLAVFPRTLFHLVKVLVIGPSSSLQYAYPPVTDLSSVVTLLPAWCREFFFGRAPPGGAPGV